MRRRSLLAVVVLSGLVLGVGLGWSAYGYRAYRDARARWSEMSGRLDEADYDPAESDRRYLEVEAWSDSIALALKVAGGAALVLVVGLRARQRG